MLRNWHMVKVSTAPMRRCGVAVVVPCYNAANTLARALDSVLAQTYTNVRLYVVDDGSTDGTPSILQRYSRYGFCVRQAHLGQATARNCALSVSRERYIAFLDADDYWLPAKLELQIALLEQNPGVGLVCSDCETVEGREYVGSYFANSGVPRTGKVFERLTRECFVFTPTVVVRRECLDQVGLFNESLAVSEDFELWLRIAAQWDIAVVPEVLAVREIRPEGLSVSTRPEIYLEHGIAALENVKAVCRGLSRNEAHALQNAIAERTYIYGSHLLASGRRRESRTKLISVLQRRPADWRAWIKYGLTFLPSGLSGRLIERRQRFVCQGN
jgi:glycosyltransferase involved in cell wall biosynthesis